MAPSMIHTVLVRGATAALAFSLSVAALPTSAAAQPTYRTAPSGRVTTAIQLAPVVARGTPAAERPPMMGVSVDYGQPHVRGRTVLGGLIPYDQVWRLGANEATALKTDVDLEFDGRAVPKGSYTLFARATPAGMELIVNKQTGQWGTQYDAEQDLVRIPMTVRTMLDAVESLQIALIPTGETAELSGTLRVVWGAVDASVPYTLKP